MSTVFRGRWQYAGPAAAVAEPGASFVSSMDGCEIVVYRTERGELRAVSNACANCGQPLVPSAWRGEDEVRGSRACHQGLAGSASSDSAAVDTWGPFVFVNAHKRPTPLAHALGSLQEVARRRSSLNTGWDVNQLKFAREAVFVVEANWKLQVENLLECYHCPVAHPKLKELDLDLDTVWVERHEGGVAHGFSEASADGAEHVSSGGYYQFPNYFLVTDATVCRMFAVVPLDERYTRLVAHFFAVGDADDSLTADSVEWILSILAEDVDLQEATARNLRADPSFVGCLLTESESQLQHFQEMWRGAIGRKLDEV
jgi:choline monooxygenase